jgi:hypothetical protein
MLLRPDYVTQFRHIQTPIRLPLYLVSDSATLVLFDFLKGKSGHYSDVISYYTPIYFLCTMFLAFPHASAYIKSSFQIRYNRFYTTSPLLQSCFHVHTAGNVF